MTTEVKFTPSPKTAAHPRMFYGWKVTISLWLIYFFITGPMTYSVSIIASRLIMERGWDASIAGLAVSVTSAAWVLSSWPAGKLCVKTGCRNTILLGCLIASAAYGLMIVLPISPALFIGLYVPLGIAGMFAALVTAPAMLNNWFRKRLSIPMALVMTAGGAAGFLIPPCIHYLSDQYGEQMCWIVFFALSVVSLLIAWFVLLEDPSDVGDVKDGRAWLHAHENESVQEEEISGAVSESQNGRQRKSVLQVYLSAAFLIITFMALVFRGMMVAFNSYYILAAAQKGITAESATLMMMLLNVASMAGRGTAMGASRLRVSLSMQAFLCFVLLTAGFSLYAVGTSMAVLLAGASSIGFSTGYLVVLIPLLYPLYYPDVPFASLYGTASILGFVGAIVSPMAVYGLSEILGSFRNANLAMTTLPAACMALAVVLVRKSKIRV